MLNTITQKIIDKNIEKKPGNHKGIVLQSVSAKGVANGLLLDMSVRQQYKNNSNKTLEVLYTFPMAWGATFMGLQATIAGQKWVGTVVEKDQAQAQYEQALDNGDTPIMLEKNADGVYTANLGNIKPAEKVTLQYTYSQVLRYEQGSIRIAMPLVIAPRYGDAKKGGMQAHHDLAHDVLAEYPFTLSLDLMGGLEWAAVESPSHQVQVSKTDVALNVAIERHAFFRS
jgi:Ca-activated chloride channel family protein